MVFYNRGPLQSGGYYEEFSDGEGGTIRLEYRVNLQTPALEIWGGRPGDLSQLAELTP